MKKLNVILMMVVLMTITLNGYSVFKSTPTQTLICPVCNMQFEKSEAYKRSYDGKKYYFDIYTCAESFKMNPKNYLGKKSGEVK